MNLKMITDTLLLNSTKILTSKEREILSIIIEHLQEIERRKLFSDLGYSSLFDYCMNELGYSEHQAYRRINAMRVIKKLPEIKQKVKIGSLTLSSINMASGLFKQAKIESKEEQMSILAKLSNKSKMKCEDIISTIKENKGIQEAPKKDVAERISKEVTRLHINLSKETIEKLERVKGLLKENDYNKLINQMADALIEKKFSLKRKLKKKKIKNSRYIPKSVKSNIYKRAKGCCEKCGSTYSLEYDHIIPYAKGGTNSEKNIQLLCKNCNLRKSIKDYGQQKMDQYLNSTLPGKVNSESGNSYKISSRAREIRAAHPQ